MDIKWSSSEVERLVTAVVNMTKNVREAQQEKKEVRAARNKALEAVHAAGDRLDVTALTEAVALYNKAEEDFEDIVKEIAMRTRVLALTKREAFCRMTADDLRELLNHESCKWILKEVPDLPTGALFEVTLPLDIGGIAFQDRTYWTPLRCMYHVGEEVGSVGCRSVRVVGPPGAIIYWIGRKLGWSRILETLAKCEDKNLIAAYIEQQKPHDIKGMK